MKKNHKSRLETHHQVMNSISKETGISIENVRLIIEYFFLGVRRIMKRNHDINLFGLFKFKMRKFYRKKVDANPSINLRLRTDINMRRRIEKNRRKKRQ